MPNGRERVLQCIQVKWPVRWLDFMARLAMLFRDQGRRVRAGECLIFFP